MSWKALQVTYFTVMIVGWVWICLYWLGYVAVQPIPEWATMPWLILSLPAVALVAMGLFGGCFAVLLLIGLLVEGVITGKNPLK